MTTPPSDIIGKAKKLEAWYDELVKSDIAREEWSLIPLICQALLSLTENLKSMEETNRVLEEKVRVAVEALEKTAMPTPGDFRTQIASEALSQLCSLT